MEYLLGVDLGTSGTKTVLFDIEGRAVAGSTSEYDFEQPQNGWAEQEPQLWWDAVQQTIKTVMETSRVDPECIRGVGVSGQMHGLVMLDERGEVLRKAIIWCDGRTGKQCEEIETRVGRERLVELTGNPALPSFTASKLLWVRENEPEIYRRCRMVLLPKDFIRYKLTGKYGQEVSDASGTNLLDIRQRDWSEEILRKLEIDPALLPQVQESTESAGAISQWAAQRTGLSTKTLVCMGGGDNACAAVGTGVIAEGRAFTTVGTSGVIFAHTDSAHIDPGCRVHTFCHAVPGAYCVMSCTLAAGMSLKWFRDSFCEEEKAEARAEGIGVYDLMSRRASSVPAGCEKLLFLPYLMGERSPVLDEKARGVFFGVSAIHKKEHFIRAVMEGVMYAQRHCLSIFHEMGITPQVMYACGGGARSPFWRQMMADVYQETVTTLRSEEGPALGAAILASVAAGLYPTVAAACEKMVCPGVSCAPQETADVYTPYYELYTSLYRMMKAAFHQLFTL